MKSQRLETLKRLTFKVLEEMCFILPSQSLRDESDERDSLIVHLRCGETSDLYLEFDARLVRIIAENFLGLDAFPEEADLIRSSVKEIGNMIGGNYMNSVNIPAENRLSIPEIVQSAWSPGERSPHYSIESETLYAEGYALTLTIVEHMV